jgi:hypothetical protein
MIKDILRCIFLPFSVINELNSASEDIASLFLLAREKTSDDKLREWLDSADVALTEEEQIKFANALAEIYKDD